MSSYKSLAAALCAAVLSGCAAVPTHVALQDEARKSVSSTEVVLPVKQSEIYIFVPDSQVAAAGGGGLLLALIDAGVNSVRTEKAETAVKPLRDAMVDYDFDKSLHDSMQSALAQVAWLHADHVRVVKDATQESFDQAVAGSSEDAVLLAMADYRLSNNAEELTVTLTTGLYPKSSALVALRGGENLEHASALKNSLYRDTFMYSQFVPNTSGDRDRNIATWSSDHGAAMRAALNRAAENLASMLVCDISAEPGTADACKGDGRGNVSRLKATGVLNYSASP
jgi:hypothetical protein